LTDFQPSIARKTAIVTSTIVPPGGMSAAYDAIIPVTTENTEIDTANIIVFLKPLPSIMAEMAGITISDEISNIPTSRIDAITVMLAMTIKR
jgi:hypothetical protein